MNVVVDSGGVWTNGGIGAAVGVGFGAVGPVTVDDDTTPTQSLSDGFEAQAWQGNDVGKVGATKGYEGVEENSGGSKLRGDEEARKEAGRLKRRRKLSAKARESNVYKGSGGDGKEAGKGVPGGSDERHDRSSGAKRQVTRRSTSCPPDGNSSRQEEQNGNGQGKEEEEEESQEEPDFVRCESTCLDRAPWREQSMPRTKLRAYRDPNGRFRVMDFKGTLLKTMWLNQHKGYKVRGKEEGSRDRSGPSQSIKANVQKTEPKENYPKASATKSIVENSDGIIAVSPTASSKGKRKSEEPSPAKEAKEPKDGQISHVQLFEAMCKFHMISIPLHNDLPCLFASFPPWVLSV